MKMEWWSSAQWREYNARQVIKSQRVKPKPYRILEHTLLHSLRQERSHQPRADVQTEDGSGGEETTGLQWIPRMSGSEGERELRHEGALSEGEGQKSEGICC